MYVYRGVSSLGPKRPGLEANQSLPSSAEVKSKCSYNPLPHNVFTQCTKTALILTERNNHCSFWVNMNISFPVHGRRLGTYLKKFPVHSALCHSVCRAPSDTVQCSTAVDSVVIISDIFHTYSTGNCCSLCTDFSLAQFTFRQPTGCWQGPTVWLHGAGSWRLTSHSPILTLLLTLELCPTVHARTIQMQSQLSFPKPCVKYFPDDGRTGADTCQK